MNLCKGASVERKAMMLFQRSEQALLTSRNISIVIVIMFVAKYTNHVAEDNFFFQKATLPPLCGKLGLTPTRHSVARDICLWGA